MTDEQRVAFRAVDSIGIDPHYFDAIARTVHGGASNIEAIFPLSPLQEGLLYHHLLSEGGDAYVLSLILELDSQSNLRELTEALQSVIDRHDALRTAVLWEDLPRPAQVVYRRALLPVIQIFLAPGTDFIEQLRWPPMDRSCQWNLRTAPLVMLRVAVDPLSGKSYAAVHIHHLICDYGSLTNIAAEIAAQLTGNGKSIPPPKTYREHIQYLCAKIANDDGEAFFREKLADVEEPTTPFDLSKAEASMHVAEATELLPQSLAERVRSLAQSTNVTPARIFHAAWALVVAKTSGRDDIVFGTVLRTRSGMGPPPIGLSINTLPLRLRLHDISLKQLLEIAHEELLQLVEHEHVPLLNAQRCSGVDAAAPLFSSLLNFRHAARNPKAVWSGVPGIKLLAVPEAKTNYPIALTADDSGKEFMLTAQAEEPVRPQRLLGYLHTAINAIVEAFASGAADSPALLTNVLPPEERETLLGRLAGTTSPHGFRGMVHELFEQQVESTRDAIAVLMAESRLTYSQLNARSNQLARYLADRGVRPGKLVGICFERSPEMVIALIAIIKAGGAYVPLDPNYPAERLRYMLHDASPDVVLTQRKLLDMLPHSDSAVIALDDLLGEINGYSTENLSVELKAADLVYVIYTSGSTGYPKGTAMAHRSMVNLIEWHRGTFGASQGVRVAQFAALSFDVAFQETFSTLCTGGTLVLLDEWVRRDTSEFVAFLTKHSIDRVFLPPLMLQSVAEYCCSTGTLPGTLRDIITAGEQLRITPEIRALFKIISGSRLHNHYGPTETHVATALTLSGDPEQWPALPSIGRPISNTQIYLLDTQQQPVPMGITGEIYVGGAGVAHGYLGETKLTTQRFMQDPFSKQAFARLYRTGDLGRWNEDGTLTFQGRNDQQIKLRGFRIEPGEIEAQLASDPNVMAAAVVLREDAPGTRRLVAYITTREGDDLPVDQIFARLRSTLPEYMIPNAIVVLKALPITPTGKLDRRALPAPEAHAYGSVQHQLPQGAMEQTLERIWRDLLGIEHIGRHDDFFRLGGHSLMVMQLAAQIRAELCIDVPVSSVLRHPTISELSAYIGNICDTAAEPI